VTSGGQAVRRPIELGVRRPGWAEVRTGLSVGEQVVVAGMERLFEGATIMPRQAIDAGADGTAGAQGPAAQAPPDTTSGR